MNRCRDTLKQLETRHRHLEDVEIPQIIATFEELKAKGVRLRRETRPLIEQIEHFNYLSELSSRPNTPPRPDGGGNKRVKNNSKSKKYKKNNSKSKKYKKKKYKSKNTRRIIPK